MSAMKVRQMRDVRIEEVANISDSVIQVHSTHQPTITQVNEGATIEHRETLSTLFHPQAGSEYSWSVGPNQPGRRWDQTTRKEPLREGKWNYQV